MERMILERLGNIEKRLDELERVQKEVVEGLAERVAKQSNQLSMNAERKQTPKFERSPGREPEVDIG